MTRRDENMCVTTFKPETRVQEIDAFKCDRLQVKARMCVLYAITSYTLLTHSAWRFCIGMPQNSHNAKNSAIKITIDTEP